MPVIYNIIKNANDVLFWTRPALQGPPSRDCGKMEAFTTVEPAHRAEVFTPFSSPSGPWPRPGTRDPGA